MTWPVDVTDSANHPDKGTQRSLSQSMIDTMVSSGFLTIVTMLTGILLTRLLGPEGRGQYGSAIFWANFGVSFLTFSLFDAAVVKIRARQHGASAYLPSLLILSAVVAAIAIAVTVICVTTGLVSIDGLSSALLLAFFIANLVVSLGHRSFKAVETANLRFHFVNIERAATPFLFMLCAGVMFLIDENSLPILMILFVATKLPPYLPRLFRYRHHLVGKIDTGLLKETASLGWKMNFSRQAVALANDADRLVLVPLWSAQMLGYYFVAMSTCGAALSLAGQAIQITLLPSLSGLEHEDRRHKIEQLIRLSTIVAAGAVLGLWITAPFLVPLVFGEEFRPAVFYVQGLVFASVLRPVISVINIGHLSGERVMPGVYMSLAFLAVFGLGFALTGFTHPLEFFIAFGLGNLASVVIGLYLLARSGLVRVGTNLFPRPSDVSYLVNVGWRYAKPLILRKKKGA